MNESIDKSLESTESTESTERSLPEGMQVDIRNIKDIASRENNRGDIILAYLWGVHYGLRNPDTSRKTIRTLRDVWIDNLAYTPEEEKEKLKDTYHT